MELLFLKHKIFNNPYTESDINVYYYKLDCLIFHTGINLWNILFNIQFNCLKHQNLKSLGIDLSRKNRSAYLCG